MGTTATKVSTEHQFSERETNFFVRQIHIKIVSIILKDCISFIKTMFWNTKKFLTEVRVK